MTKANLNEIEINGVKYVPSGTELAMAQKVDGMEYVIVRASNAGVFAGHLVRKIGNEVTLRNSRRLWYWDGASSLSQLAMEGTSKPENCKFPCPVVNETVIGVIEIISCTEKARQSIEGVEIWKS